MNVVKQIIGNLIFRYNEYRKDVVNENCRGTTDHDVLQQE